MLLYLCMKDEDDDAELAVVTAFDIAGIKQGDDSDEEDDDDDDDKPVTRLKLASK